MEFKNFFKDDEELTLKEIFETEEDYDTFIGQLCRAWAKKTGKRFGPFDDEFISYLYYDNKSVKLMVKTTDS